MELYIDIYTYRNYRDYLRDYHFARKQRDPKFSHRFFAMKAGFSSSGLYSNIVKGVNNLSPKYLPKFIKGLGLPEREALFFTHMVDHTHAQTPSTRQEAWEKMVALMPPQKRRVLESQKALYDKWYHVAVFNALEVLEVEDDFAELGCFINPSISKVQAKHSLLLLKTLGLVEKNASGFWKPTGKQWVGGREVGAWTIHRYQDQMMELAKEAQERYTPTERFIVSKTITTSDHALRKLREGVEKLFREADLKVLSEEKSEQIFQFNVQFFPLSRCEFKGDE